MFTQRWQSLFGSAHFVCGNETACFGQDWRLVSDLDRWHLGRMARVITRLVESVQMVTELAHPPVREAILDFRVRYLPAVEAQAFAALGALLPHGFGDAKPIVQGQFSMEVSPEGSTAHTEHQLLGYRFDNAGDGLVVQFHVAGLTVSQLQPYRGWAPLLERTRSLAALLHGTHPFSIERTGTRHINHLQLPAGGSALSDWLAVVPPVPAAVAGKLESAVMRTVSRDALSGICTAIGVGLEPGPEPGQTSCTLDIDCFVEGSYRLTDEALWLQVQALHDAKNTAFFHSLREPALELYR